MKGIVMREHLEFATTLRKLLRRADRFGYDRQRLAEEILFVAENCEAVAERMEMDMIIQMQRDLVEAS
jgi:hypothetical protein